MTLRAWPFEEEVQLKPECEPDRNTAFESDDQAKPNELPEPGSASRRRRIRTRGPFAGDNHTEWQESSNRRGKEILYSGSIFTVKRPEGAVELFRSPAG